MTLESGTELYQAAPRAGSEEARWYEEYARPELARMLRVLGLEVAFTRAEGDTLAYTDEQGRERVVLDLLGGYGACLLGHNHPEIVAEARRLLDEATPVQAQASVRPGAGRLAKVLSDQVKAWTGEECVTTLCNSGAEAIEAALKLAELERVNRMKEIVAEFQARSHTIRRRVREGTCKIPDGFYTQLAQRCGALAIRDLEEALFHWNRKVLADFDRRPVFLALEGAFHGKTCGAVQLTYNREYRQPFLGLGFPVVFVPSGDTIALRRAIEEHAIEYLELDINLANELEVKPRTLSNVAAMFVEPVQGEGGIHVLESGYAATIRSCADRVRFPVIADEIQCGMGRTGTFLASREVGLKADYYAFSKSLGGGLAKIAALTVVRRRYVPEFGMLHTSTFAEDEPSCRLALKAIDLVTRDDGALMAACREKGQALLGKLRKLVEKWPSILKEARGLGLMIGVEFHPQVLTSSRLLDSLSKQKLLGHLLAGWFLHEAAIRVGRTLSQPFTLRVEPSALVAPTDLDRFVEALDRLCEILKKANTYELIKYMVGLATPGARGRVLDFSKTRPRTEVPRFAKRVAFLAHFISPEHMALWEPSLYLLPRDRTEEFFRKTCRVVDPTLCDQFLVRSNTGETVALMVIGLTVTSANITESMRARDLEWIQEKIETGVRIAKENGCTVVGFGGYTSIVTNNCKSVREGGIGLTSGNSLTTAMGIQGVVDECRRNGIDLPRARLAALGAAGNICSTYAMILAETIPEVVLVGRPGSEDRLRRVGGEIYFEAYKAIKMDPNGRHEGVAGAVQGTRTLARVLESTEGIGRIGEWIFENLRAELGGDRAVRLSTEVSALRGANVIISASNAGEPVVFPEHLGPGQIVICDIAVPNDVSERVVRERPDVHVIQGGIVQLPNDQDLVIPGVPLEDGQIFACMAETMLLGLTGIGSDYSYGSIAKMQVKKIMELARLHGFRLARAKVERSF